MKQCNFVRVDFVVVYLSDADRTGTKMNDDNQKPLLTGVTLSCLGSQVA